MVERGAVVEALVIGDVLIMHSDELHTFDLQFLSGTSLLYTDAHRLFFIVQQHLHLLLYFFG